MNNTAGPARSPWRTRDPQRRAAPSARCRLAGTRGRRAVLHLRGEVDAATVARWERDRPSPGTDGTAHGVVVAVDASAAPFLNSAGVALLVRETDAHRRAGGRPELRNPSRTVLQALRLTVMADLFDVVTD